MPPSLHSQDTSYIPDFSEYHHSQGTEPNHSPTAAPNSRPDEPHRRARQPAEPPFDCLSREGQRKPFEQGGSAWSNRPTIEWGGRNRNET
eukprot:scaffold49379_cov52-Phaeocystis_antarctica.AAC.3